MDMNIEAHSLYDKFKHPLHLFASKGLLKVMKWIYRYYGDNVCPRYSLSDALINKHIHIANWILEVDPKAMDEVLILHDLSHNPLAKQWLLENRCINDK